MDLQIFAAIRGAQMFAESLPRRFHRDFVDRHLAILEVAGRASRQIGLDGLPNGSAAELDRRLVDVVMQDESEALEIMTAERVAESFGQGAADHIGMAKAFALDDFDLSRENRRCGKRCNA